MVMVDHVGSTMLPSVLIPPVPREKLVVKLRGSLALDPGNLEFDDVKEK